LFLAIYFALIFKFNLPFSISISSVSLTFSFDSKSFCTVSADLDAQLHPLCDVLPFLNFAFVNRALQLVVLFHQMSVAWERQHPQQSISSPLPFYPHNVFEGISGGHLGKRQTLPYKLILRRDWGR
jgi:hypothetical protein